MSNNGSDITSTQALFNSKAVLDYFDFVSRTPDEEKAMQCLYRCMAEERPDLKSKKPGQEISLAGITVDKMESRYMLFKLHADHFFPVGYEPNLDALAIAVICDKYTGHINESVNPPQAPQGWNNHNDNIKRYNDGFSSQALIDDAYALWDNASEIEEYGIPEGADMPALECIFLAHINTLEEIEENNHRFDAFDIDDLETMLVDYIKVVKDFICPHTSIGEELQERLDEFGDRVMRAAMKPDPSLPNKGFRVVINEGLEP